MARKNRVVVPDGLYHIVGRVAHRAHLLESSEFKDRIVEWIRKDMKKTCTVMDSSGAVSGNNKTIICYVTYFELQKFREYLKELGDNTFITVSTIDEIMLSH